MIYYLRMKDIYFWEKVIDKFYYYFCFEISENVVVNLILCIFCEVLLNDNEENINRLFMINY